ncbi:SDR family oxidoreductase [Candidatus Berkelbacteria bacterium]|nr:SDR family oxidoreductase [Candidatus Berkelbacteria bacterium]
MKTHQVILITGASSGIGLALARLAAADGCDLVLIARRHERLKALKGQLERSHDVSVSLIVADLTDPDTPSTIVKELNARQLDVEVLINNAGVGVVGSFATTDWEKEAAMIDVNIRALTHLTKLLVPGMIERHSGRILNLSSMAAFVPGPGMAVYYASKAFVQSFSEALAEELRGTGVTVTTLNPGPTETEFALSAGGERAGLFRRRLPTAAVVAAYGYRALMAGRRIAVPGLDLQFGRFLARFLPSSVITAYIKGLH